MPISSQFSPSQCLSNRSEIRNKSFPIRNATKGKKHYGRFTDRYQTTLVIYSDKQARRQYFSKLIYFNHTDPSQTMISRKKTTLSRPVVNNGFIGCHSLHANAFRLHRSWHSMMGCGAPAAIPFTHHGKAMLCFSASAFLYSHMCT